MSLLLGQQRLFELLLSGVMSDDGYFRPMSRNLHENLALLSLSYFEI